MGFIVDGGEPISNRTSINAYGEILIPLKINTRRME
jgi:hypothetical protein